MTIQARYLVISHPDDPSRKVKLKFVKEDLYWQCQATTEALDDLSQVFPESYIVEDYVSQVPGTGKGSHVTELPKQTLWLLNAADPTTPTSVDDLSGTVDSLYNDIAMHGAEGIDFSYIAYMSPDINIEHAATALRATYSYRDRIKHWDKARDAVLRACNAQNKDYRDVMAGLH